jgi:tRNA1Val (adenine37-N6)-methyltransferase
VDADLLAAPPVAPAAVIDSFWQGRLRVWQPGRGGGYRFNLDAILLAAFAPAGSRILDLGSGCGIVGLLLLAAGKAQQVTAVEVQPQLAELARRNARDNGFQDRLAVVQADLRDFGAGQPPFDVVVFNPPYFTGSGGRLCPEPGRDQARNERHGTQADFVVAASRLLRPGGRVAAIVRQQRGDELLAQCQDHRLQPTRRRLTYARPLPGAPAQQALVEAAAALPTPGPQQAPLPAVAADRPRQKRPRL